MLFQTVRTIHVAYETSCLFNAFPSLSNACLLPFNASALPLTLHGHLLMPPLCPLPPCSRHSKPLSPFNACPSPHNVSAASLTPLHCPLMHLHRHLPHFIRPLTPFHRLLTSFRRHLMLLLAHKCLRITL